MRSWIRPTTAIAFAALTACLALTTPQSAVAQAPAADAGAPGGGRGARFAQDPRAQTRTYHFEDTNEDLPYSVYVSTKVKPDQKAPMIVTLHGLGAPQTIMMGKAAIDLAEEGGYILVAPMGYNVSGWYGTPAFAGGGRGGGRGRGNGAPGAAGNGPGGAPAGRAGLVPANQPANVRELSEKDVMNVITMARKEFNIDNSRIYIMGHSMGGAGALFLGSKYASMFAAVAAEAPAAFWQTRKETMQPLKDAKVPVMIVQGDIDEMVPVANTREWVDVMKGLGLEYEYVEQPGITHGPVIQSGLKPIYEFFAKHSKNEARP
jgi:predicted peptidase